MSNEQLIADAILQLKNDTNIFKDYLFPIAMAFFSSLIGAVAGYFVYLRQEKSANEKRKIDLINKWILIADELHQNILSIKLNYHGRLSAHPYQRAIFIPVIIKPEKKYQFDYFELAFITESKITSQWLSIPFLRTLFANYEVLVSIWSKRNEFYLKVRDQLFESQQASGAFVDLSDEEIEKYTDHSDLSTLIDLTERALRLTDDLVIEYYNFLYKFPNVVKNKVDLKLISNYTKIIETGIENNKAIHSLLIDSPKPDYEKISELSGRSIEELMARYSSLFK